MEVCGVFGEGALFDGGDAGGDLFGAVGDDINVSDELGFFDGFGGPGAGVGIVSGLAVTEEVHGGEGELSGGAAGHEEDAVAFGDIEEFFDVGDGFVVYGGVFFSAVAHFHDGHAGVLVVDEFGLGFL